MKLLKVLASLGTASIFAIPLCFGSSFTKPSSAISDAAYSSNWDGVTGTGASKNALYDVISTLGGGHDEVTVNTTAAYLLSVSGQDLRTNTTRTGLWDTAYAYGNHATAGYLTSYTEGDYIFGNSAAVNVTNSGISNWNTAYSWGNHAIAGYLTTFSESDPVFSAAAAVNVTTSGIANWNTAYAYGNHQAAGYLTAFTESDPIYAASNAANLTLIGYWNTAYAYGNHQAAGYLKNIVEDTSPQLGANLDLNSFYIGGMVLGTDIQAWDTDLDDLSDKTTTGQYTFGNVVVTDEAYDATNWDNATTVPTKNAIRDKIEALPGGHAAVTLNANADFLLALSTQELTVNTTRTGLWDLAYAWGNHAAVGYVEDESDPVYAASNAANLTLIGYWNAAYAYGNHAAVGYLTAFNELDPDFDASVAANIDALDVGNWDLAVAWGNHAAAGYLTTFSELDPDFNSSVAANIDALDVGNWDLAVTWGNHAAVGYVEDESDPVYAASNAANLTLIGYWNTAYAYGNHATAGYLKAITATEVTSNAYGNIVATNVQEAIEELDREKSLGTHDHSGTYEPAGVTGFEVTITPAGNIASGNVGYALNELDMEKATVAHAHTGAELSGIDIGDDTNLAAGRSLTLSGDSVEADTELYTDTKCIWIESPLATDDLKSIWFAKTACTLTSIWCESDQTATLSLWVDDGSAAVVDSVNLTCDATPPEDTSLDGDATMASGDRLDLDVYSVASTPTWVSVCWTYTKDD
jgi:hypothetical protein